MHDDNRHESVSTRAVFSSAMQLETTGRGAPPGPRNGKYKHGMKATPEWKAWVNARRRCTDPNHPDWKNYGGRGITMCAAWRASFAAFYQHIGPRPAGLTLDRIENDRGYQPGNVRWATRAEQTRNRRPIRASTSTRRTARRAAGGPPMDGCGPRWTAADPRGCVTCADSLISSIDAAPIRD